MPIQQDEIKLFMSKLIVSIDLEMSNSSSQLHKKLDACISPFKNCPHLRHNYLQFSLRYTTK